MCCNPSLRDSKVVRVSECLLDQARPLLRDLPDLCLAVRSEDLELDVSPAGKGAPGPLDDESNIPISVRDIKPDKEV